jgi:hypothetical protein
METYTTTLMLFEPNPFRRGLYQRHLERFVQVRVVGDVGELASGSSAGKLGLVSLAEAATERKAVLVRLMRLAPSVPLLIFDSKPYNAPDFAGLTIQMHANRSEHSLLNTIHSVADFFKGASS